LRIRPTTDLGSTFGNTDFKDSSKLSNLDITSDVDKLIVLHNRPWQ